MPGGLVLEIALNKGDLLVEYKGKVGRGII